MLDMPDSKGKSVRSEFAVKLDGRDYPVAGLPDVDSISLRKVDAYTFDCSYKKAGRRIKDERIVVSKDGMRATFFRKEGDDPQQPNFTVVSVWDRQ